MEYALNSNPTVSSRADLPKIEIQNLDLEDQPKDYITFSFTRQGQSSDLVYSVEVSEDLKEWKKDIAILESTTINADSTVKEMWRSPIEIKENSKWFFRLSIKN